MNRPAMRVPRDKLILWSLCALSQRAEQATAEPLKPDFGMKVVLALLHVLGAERPHVDAFWAAMIAVHPASFGPSQAAYVRGTSMRTAIECIMRSLKVGDALLRQEMHEALHGPSKQHWTQHERILDQLRRDRAEQAERRRQRGDCG